MQSTLLGRTGLEVGRIALGTMNFGGRTDEATALSILDRAVERGVSLIDTANVYGHEAGDFMSGRGRSEEIIGRWLQSRRRDDVVIATKMFFPMSEAQGSIGSSRRNIVRECERSLRRLGVDTIDLYQVHHPSNDIPIDETLGALDDLVRAGKVRYVGSSSFAAWQLTESLWASDVRRLVRFVTEQPVYNLLDRRIERELAPMAETYDIALLTWSPLAGGVIGDAYSPDADAPAGSRHEAFWAGRHRKLTRAVFEVVAAVRDLAAERGMSTAAFGHAWVSGRPEPTCVLLGPRTIEHLEQALDACELSLDTEAIAAIDELVAPGGHVFAQYGSDGLAWHPWGPHRRAWR